MDVRVVNRIMALQRQCATVRSAVKRGDITEAEAKVVIAAKEEEIATIRKQASLDLSEKRK